MQCEIQKRQRFGLKFARHYERAPNHQADDGHLDVIEFDIGRCRVVFENLCSQCLACECVQIVDFVLKRFALVRMLHHRQIQQVSGVEGLIGR